MQSSKLHLAVQRNYPKAQTLPLPPNVDPNEISRFSPLRNRDITASAISVHREISEIDVTLEQQKRSKTENLPNESDDGHSKMYDRNSPCNLSATMQTLVPDPFKPPCGDDQLQLSYGSFLSFPGGSWGKIQNK